MVMSTRFCFSSATACVKPSTASTFAPAFFAVAAKLLVTDCAEVLPRTSAMLRTEVSSVRVTTTPVETVYGAENAYLAWRSGLTEIWLATTSYRPASSPAKMASKVLSENWTGRPSRSPTARTTSTSYPVSSLVLGSWKVNGAYVPSVPTFSASPEDEPPEPVAPPDDEPPPQAASALSARAAATAQVLRGISSSTCRWPWLPTTRRDPARA